MKGLLLKDWYMAKKYCRAHVLMTVVFIAVSMFGNDNLFFVFYPCLMCGIIPVTLLGYDERSRWLQYSATLPYTKAQIVSSKYLIGLLAQLAVLIFTAIAQAVKTKLSGAGLAELAVVLLMMLAISTFASSISLPFIFKLGVEKGRIAYYVMIGFVCGAAVLASGVFSRISVSEAEGSAVFAVLAVFGVAVYALSWYLSVVFFKKREIH